jgi:hypothetical protein
LLAFNREAADFRRLVTRMPPGLAVRPLVFERTARAFPGNPAHLHVPAYYCLEKGGGCGHSFAMYSISVVRYRSGVRVLMGGGSEWAPERFDAAREAADYDYFIVKSPVDLSRELFSGRARLRCWTPVRAIGGDTGAVQPKRRDEARPLTLLRWRPSTEAPRNAATKVKRS